MTNHQATTLVIGGTGKTGRRIVQRLAERGVPTRVGSRPAFGWDDRSTWAPALAGVEAMYVSYYPDLAVPGAPETVGALAELAVRSGVGRLVLLSGRGEENAELAEQAVQKAGVDWTILRSSWFDQNFSESYLLEPILDGEVALPVSDVVEPFVDIDDIADAAVAALTDDRHAGRLYEVTGPRAITFADAVAEIARVTQRDIRFVPVTIVEYTCALTAAGIPEDVVGLLTYLFTEVLDGRNSRPTNGIQAALGREPRDFRVYAEAAAQAGAWR